MNSHEALTVEKKPTPIAILILEGACLTLLWAVILVVRDYLLNTPLPSQQEAVILRFRGEFWLLLLIIPNIALTACYVLRCYWRYGARTTDR